MSKYLDDLSTGVGMSTLPERNDAQFFYPCLKSCALHRESSGGTCVAADDSVCILGKRESKEEPISFMPMEKLVRGLPRYRNRGANPNINEADSLPLTGVRVERSA